MDDDLLELTAVTNLLLYLHEVQLGNEFARQEDGRNRLRGFAKAIEERIRARSRPEDGQPATEESLEIQARMLTRWHRLVASAEQQRAHIRTRLTGDPG